MTVSGAQAAARFVPDFMPAWLAIAISDGTEPAPVIEKLGDPREEITTWAQARTVFTLAHLGLAAQDQTLIAQSARIKAYMMDHLIRPEGGCRMAIRGDGRAYGSADKDLCRTYDFAFVLLGLVTLQKADASAVTDAEIAACRDFIDAALTDPSTGALWENDAMGRDGPKDGDTRAQNPHMHMAETYLQCFEMTGAQDWADRAKRLLEIGADYFIEPLNGGMREFLAPDLTPMASALGQRCEPGHQYEWAWLYLRYGQLTGDQSLDRHAEKLAAFAARCGLRSDGPLKDAPFDAFATSGAVIEDTHLLWPLTEAGKFHAMMYRLTDDDAHMAALTRIADIIFGHYFAADARAEWVNQLDANGAVVWADGLTRVLYHMAIFITEGALSGAWTLKEPMARI
ncbi:AGE family epimerase/isomerase [Sagittula sp. SSi028]|uniref:AGE family epimerase/isomerase n=1 Tax=Sagittula sp. SSi028 TaxID=3400636 RepID=UPI003AF64F48